MRWPIQIQLLLPMLTVVILAIVLTSGASAYLGGKYARQTQDENLQRVVTTLSEAKFPLTDSVLRQMSGLSGAEFILFEGDVPRARTLRLDNVELARLWIQSGDNNLDALGTNHSILIGGRVYLSQHVPVKSRFPTAQSESLIVLAPEDRMSSAVRQAVYPVLGVGAAAVMAVIVVTTILSHRFVRPIHQLGNQTAAIAMGDFTPVLVSNRNDEIRDLTLSINQMAQQLRRYEKQVRHNERLRTLGKLGAGMAHQLRNAATGGLMAIELHKRRCKTDEDGESLDVALRQLHLMESYLQRFLLLGQGKTISFETVSLDEVVGDALELVRPSCAHAGIDLKFTKPQSPIQLHGDYDALRQLVINLTLNSTEAVAAQIDPPPRIVVDLHRIGKERAALHIRDTGPGPDQDVAERLFEPFVSGKQEGTGLGLFVASQVADAHNATIRWERKNNMTCFIVEFTCCKEDINSNQLSAISSQP